MYNESNGGSKSPYQYHPKSPAAQSAPYIPLSTSYPLYPAASSSTQCSFDLLKGKVEHLENERVNLSLQMQEQSEKDRTRKIRIEQLESDLKISYAAQVSLKQVGEESQAKIKLLVDSNADLVEEIVKLNERIEVQAKEASGAQNFWSKMTAAHRELRRLEDEALKTRRERANLEAEKEELLSEITKLEELNEKRSEEMTLLRLEIEGQRRTFKDSKTALETANASMSVEALSLRGALQEALESKELVEENFEIERCNFEGKINELMKQLACGPRPRPEPVFGGISDGDDEEQVDSVFVDGLRKKLLESEMKRKQLHNTLQELRGNIRVFVRCRPILPGDGEEYPNSENLDPNVGGCVRFHKDGTSVSLSSSSTTRSTPQVFTFDQVFKCDSSQDEVFSEVSDLVQSALDGYKVCIFSYGQTGSGKTHTHKTNDC
jgi:kinesin family member C1